MPATTPPELSRERALDALIQGIWSLAAALHEDSGIRLSLARAQVPGMPTSAPPDDGTDAGDDDPDNETRREQGARDAFMLLDSLARLGIDTQFPYPGSPRLDGVGGGRRIAPDGSPGIPASWIRWMTQPRVYDARRDQGARHAPLLLAVAWLMKHEPALWRVYAARVLEGARVQTVADREQTAPSTIYARLARARVLLLAQIAYFTGTSSLAEYHALMHLIDAAHEDDAPGV